MSSKLVSIEGQKPTSRLFCIVGQVSLHFEINVNIMPLFVLLNVSVIKNTFQRRFEGNET